MTALEKVKTKAKELSRKDQLSLAQDLLDEASEDFASPEIERAWLKEAEHRLREMRSGKVKGVSVKKAIAEARALLKK